MKPGYYWAKYLRSPRPQWEVVEVYESSSMGRPQVYRTGYEYNLELSDFDFHDKKLRAPR